LVRHTARVPATFLYKKGCLVSELLSSFTLWGGLSVAFAGWVMGYAYHIETRRHASNRQALPAPGRTPALSIVRKLN
jgi:hypothetical protein